MTQQIRLFFTGILALSAFFSNPGLASNDQLQTSAERIEEAKLLYGKAVPMATDSKERQKILDQAIAILKDVIANEPTSLDAHRKLMGAYLLKQDYHNSIRTIQDAINLSPEDPKLFITLAFLYEHSGALDFSSSMIEQALKLDPDNKVALDYKLVIQQKIQKMENSMSHHGSAMSPHSSASQ